jgi:PhoD-like phosphatase
MAELLVGPLLRYVDETTVSVWVETDEPAEVRVALEGSPPTPGAHTSRTFTVHGHHYAVVDVDGLEPGADIPYTVTLDDQPAWPLPDAGAWHEAAPHEDRTPPGPAPPTTSRIRTLDCAKPLRLVFGSCRMSLPHDRLHTSTHGVDVLRVYAQRLAELPGRDWPAMVLLLGDQVYADETSPAMRDIIRARRDPDVPPGLEVADFEEYAQLYELAWTDPWIRWLLSTVPTAMIFDDHDVRDDWNTSWTWRQQMHDQPWWRDRITGGLAAYWVYQHIGNLPPSERQDDPAYAAVRQADGDAGDVLDEFAWKADQEPSGYRWSYARDLGSVRLVMLDSRAGRDLQQGTRRMIGDDDWAWFEDQVRGDHEHLLIGTSLPYLLPPGIHHVEAWNEAVAGGAWGRRATRLGERIRQGIDLEHWAAFGESFEAMARTVRDVASGRRGNPPATVLFLSGDVHFSYAARASFAHEPDQVSRVCQLVCSPLRNPMQPLMRVANMVAASGPLGPIGRVLAGAAKLRRPGIGWNLPLRPVYGNAVATLDLSGRQASARWETVTHGGSWKELGRLDV